ncbi:hypothetical protein DMH26_17620 [Streptomyces sp. WAC 05379]|nr:hypothetical protein DMH26_17620 [Streptomyces sp. WAC 05379]
MSRAEEAAVKVVTTLLAAEHGVVVSHEHWDVPPRQGAHDFWLRYGGRKEALEITTFADQDTKTHAAHWQKRGPGFSTMVEGVTSAWTILVDPGFRAEALTRNLAEWLRALESEGILETGRWDSSRVDTHPVAAALASAGVMIAQVVSGPPAGLVSLAFASAVPPRAAGDPDHISRALTEVLALERHQKDAAKLERSLVPVRHLFFWIDLTSRLDVVRAFEEGVPTAAPTVDDRITWVWLAVPTEDGADVLRWSAACGWRRDAVAASSAWGM